MWDDIVSTEDIDNLRHMLGVQANLHERAWGYRNYFCPGGDNVKSMERLEKAGLARKGKPYNVMHYYHATEKGMRIAGLTAEQIRRARNGGRR